MTLVQYMNRVKSLGMQTSAIVISYTTHLCVIRKKRSEFIHWPARVKYSL